ncbi:DUF4156 domain-containing protein [Parahaliea maris]|nr:DUF4156 domain-containing protein [Parahaliea maris]
MRSIFAGLLLLPLAACSWVDLTPQGETVTVVSAAPTHCKRLGNTVAITRSELASIDRNRKKVETELQTLARNAGARMGGDTVVAESEVNAQGEQTYGVYRCGAIAS